VIGTLGTSGFIGILLGPQISDWICGSATIGRAEVHRMFVLAAVIAAVATLSAWLATSRDVPPIVRSGPGIWRLMRKYLRVSVSLVAAAMGAGFAIPMTFLSPFASELGIQRIGPYFAVYAMTAFGTRMATRRLFQRHGNRPWILVGMLLLTASFAMYLPVKSSWQLVVPGAVAGVAHALLFPSIMSAGTIVFPRRFRGIATSLMLAMYDFGTFLGAPVVGAFLRYSRDFAAGPYPLMFAGTALLFLVITVGYWRCGPRDTAGGRRARAGG
jgi:MFS family permease